MRLDTMPFNKAVKLLSTFFLFCCAECPQVPGLGMRLDTTRLDLVYNDQYGLELPDAYERLLMDVVNGGWRRRNESACVVCNAYYALTGCITLVRMLDSMSVLCLMLL